MVGPRFFSSSKTSPQAHRFVIDELSGDPDVLRSGVTAVTVSYAVEIPPTLTRLVAALQEGAPPEDIVLPSS